MLSFKNFANRFNARNFTPYLMIAALLIAVIIPVWAAPTQVSTFAQLKAAVTAGGNIKLMADIVDEETDCLEITKDITLDLNGHKLSKTNITATTGSARFFFNIRNGIFTINNTSSQYGEILAAGATKTANPRAVAANVVQENCNAKVIVNNGVKLSATNPTISGSYNESTYDNAYGYPLGVYTPNNYMTDARKNPSSRTSSAEAIVNDGATLNGLRYAVVLEGYGSKLTVNGGVLNAARTGIYNGAGGEVIINGGVISASFRNALQNIKATMTINGGTALGKNRNSISNSDDDDGDYPSCSAKGIMNVKNGIFEGGVWSDTSNGNILKIYKGKFTQNVSNYLADGATGTWESNYYVVRNYQINTAQEFLDAVVAGGSYKLGSNIVFTSYVEMFKDFTLDMNGHKLSRTNITAGASEDINRYFLLVRNGTFTINNNSSTQGQIYAAASSNTAAPRAVTAYANASGYNAKVIVNGDVLIKAYNPYGYDKPESGIHGMAVYTPTSYMDDTYSEPAQRKMSSEVIINKGTIVGTKTAIALEGYGTKLTVNGGIFNGGKHGIANWCGGEVIINYATVNESKNALTTEKATTVVKDGIFTGTSTAINLWSDSDNTDYPNCAHATETRVNGGTFTGELEPDQGTILVSGGSFTVNPIAYIAEGYAITQKDGYYNVQQSMEQSSGNYNVSADEQGEIPGQIITAKIKILFKDLEEMLVTGVQAVVNYATDVLELVSAQKSSISGATTPITETAGKVNFGLVNSVGVAFNDNQYYDFGTITFKIKQAAAVGAISELFITDATYSLNNVAEKTATTTGTDIEIYQPVTNINITSQTGETTILVQNTLQLEAEVLPTTAQTKDIQWTSSDTSVATVDANGLVTAQLISGKTATATITATALDGSGVTATKQITVKRPKVASMNFAQAAYELETDDTTKDLYAELSVAPALAIKPAANEITWNSSNPNFAVNASGIVSIITPTEDKQETTITATYTNENSETITTNCTVNSKPKKIKFNLTTKLEGRQNGGGTGTNIENVEIYLYDSANNSLWNGSGTTDTNGKINFEIDASILEAGQSVKLWIKGEHYLAQLTTETVTIENDNEWNLTMSEKLKAGDANGDNWINLTDFGILGNTFLKKKTASGYDARADFNADEWVNLTDFGLLGNNFLKKGANKPEAAITMFMTAAANKGTLTTAMSVLSPQTAKIAEETLANSTATDQETQEEEILAAIQTATNAPLNATSTASTTDSSTSNNSSGGCNAGYGALALMFAIPMIFKKKKK